MNCSQIPIDPAMVANTVDNFGTAILQCVIQRGITAVIAQVGIGAEFEKRTDDRLVRTVCGGNMERGAAIAIQGIDFSLVGQQQLDHFQVAFARSEVQRVAPFVSMAYTRPALFSSNSSITPSSPRIAAS